MAGGQIENSSCMPAAEVERVLDRVIDGLAKMDADLLLQLTWHCREWEGNSHCLMISHAAHARLSWKLLLLDRLLRQTRVNLKVLGLEPRSYEVPDGYRAYARR